MSEVSMEENVKRYILESFREKDHCAGKLGKGLDSYMVENLQVQAADLVAKSLLNERLSSEMILQTSQLYGIVA